MNYRVKLKEKINKENFMAIKATVSEIMEKKNELQSQIQDFKDSMEEIKSKKEKILTIVDNMKEKEPIKTNRVWELVEQKRNK